MPRSANRIASSSKNGWSPRTSGRITIPAPVPCSGRARNARNCFPSSPLRLRCCESMAAPLIGSIGGRLSWVVHMPRMMPRWRLQRRITAARSHPAALLLSGNCLGLYAPLSGVGAACGTRNPFLSGTTLAATAIGGGIRTDFRSNLRSCEERISPPGRGREPRARSSRGNRSCQERSRSASRADRAEAVRYDPRPMSDQLVVQKFGGSSLGEAARIRRVAQRIARARATGAELVVVVSAMGDTTDELLQLAAAITDEPDPRELDMLLATGEHQSATLVSMALHALGVKAISLTGAQAGITTDSMHGKARIANVEPRRVRRELDNGNVVIVAGFQGQRQGSEDEDGGPGETTTLGRGGSDTTAVALAAALRADRCQIFTDVRGIYTADPRLVAGRAPAQHDRLRGDARARAAGRPGDAGSRRRAGLDQRRRDRGPLLVRGRAGYADQGGSARGAAQQGSGAGPRPQRREGHAARRAGSAGHRAVACSGRSRTPGSTWT